LQFVKEPSAHLSRPGTGRDTYPLAHNSFVSAVDGAGKRNRRMKETKVTKVGWETISNPKLAPKRRARTRGTRLTSYVQKDRTALLKGVKKFAAKGTG
jgi:hypothetical protein